MLEERMPTDFPKLAPGVTWLDDWYAIERIAPGITAIGEPRYHQQNWHFLIEGANQSVLFDTGPGERDVTPIVRILTDKPVAALASHMHYDHTGNLHRFKNIWVADVPVIRECIGADGMLHVPDILHLGSHENRDWNPVAPSRWLTAGSKIDLGNRNLDVIATPGHAVDHIALFDRTANILFAADFIYLGELYAQVPGADLVSYLTSAEALAAKINSKTLILGAHGAPDADGKHAAPRLGLSDLSDLIRTLTELKASGAQPSQTVVNERMTLLASPMSYSAWQTR
jgi:hydroxyacylglutathione hydrolase